MLPFRDPSAAVKIRGLVAVKIHFHFSVLVIPQSNKTVWPMRLAPVGPTLLAKRKIPNKKKKCPDLVSVIKWNVNLCLFLFSSGFFLGTAKDRSSMLRAGIMGWNEGVYLQ